MMYRLDAFSDAFESQLSCHGYNVPEHYAPHIAAAVRLFRKKTLINLKRGPGDVLYEIQR